MADFALSNSAVLLSIFSLCLLYALFKLFHKQWWTPFQIRRLMRSQGIHGPPFRFFYGNSLDITKMKLESMRKSLDISDHNILPRVHPHIHLWINKYGKNYVQWSGPVAQLVVADPDTAREILHNREQACPKMELGGYAARIFGNGISTSDGEKWTKSRRIADYAFHGDILKNMTQTIISCAETMLEKWKSHLGKELDMFEEFMVFSSDIIAHTAFGSSYLEGKIVFETLSKLSMMLFKSQFKRSLPGLRIFLLLKQKREGEELETRIRTSIEAIIREREEKVMSGEANNYGNDFLGLLLKAKNDPIESQRMSLSDVVDECKTMYFAGQETTSVLLGWAGFLLATHVDWQEEARKEVKSIFGNENPTLEGISKLRTMSMIIKEALRLYPPAMPASRKVKKEVRLGKIVVPPNSIISISSMALHHDTEVWGEDAHLFKPERFSAEAATKIPPGAYIPFGLGPRNCVGNMLALNETKIALSMILQRYSFTISPSHVHAPYQFLTICPQHGILVKLHSLSD